MQITKYIVSLCLLILTTSVARAETATSGNLLPNAGDGRSNPQNQTSTLDNTNVNSGFTLDSGITAWANELEAEGTGTVSATGSLENITTTTQSGNSHTTTTTSLDGGVTLNSSTEVQNCEHSSSAYRCGRDYPGVDSYSTTLKILDENNNVLASTSITRNNDAGYNNSTYTYTDTVTHNNTGARKWDWQWQGINGNNPNTTSPDGPNLLGASLTATLLDITYTPISEETQEQLEETNELIEEAIEEIKFEEIKLEEIEIQEVKMEEIAVVFEENFKQILKEENLMEEFETALMEESITEEEFFEEVSSVMEEELIAMSPPKEEKNEEIIEETPTEEVIEEKPTSTKTEEEPNATNNESTTTETSATEETLETNKETESTGQKDEDVSTESEMVEDSETEGQTETESDVEVVENETDVDVKDGKVVTDISKKVARIIKKLEAKLKRVDDKIKATSYVLAVTLQNLQPDMGEYINKRIYNNQANLVGVPNDEFFDKINILEQQQIYKDASLNAYISNDPIAVQARLLTEIETKKLQLRAEIAALRSN